MVNGKKGESDKTPLSDNSRDINKIIDSMQLGIDLTALNPDDEIEIDRYLSSLMPLEGENVAVGFTLSKIEYYHLANKADEYDLTIPEFLRGLMLYGLDHFEKGRV